MEESVRRFLVDHELCRFATAAKTCMPHVVPVSYIFLNDNIYISTDYNTKKYRNLKENASVAAVIDDVKPQRGVLVQGHARIIEAGDKWKSLYSEFYKKFEWTRKEPWNEGEAPFIELNIEMVTSWGL